MYSDDLWNLVYVCNKCNARKNNNIPSSKDILKLKERNERLKLVMEDNNIKNKLYDELILAIEKDYVNKFWVGSKS